MAKTLTIKTRDQLGRYLQQQAEAFARLAYERSVLRELVAEANEYGHRLPTAWVAQAKKALRNIKE